MSEPKILWSLSEALAWVATRDPDVTTRAATTETVNGLIVLLVRAESSGVRSPHAEGSVGPPRSVSALHEPWAALADAIASGRVDASGRPGQSFAERQARLPLGAAALDVKPDSEGLDFGGIFLRGEGTGCWYDVRLDGAALIQTFPKAGEASARIHRTGGPGRPTSLSVIRLEAERRLVTNEQWNSLAEFARGLETWFRTNHRDAPPATAKTISNRLRDMYRKARPK
jgi:hypothetical protein